MKKSVCFGCTLFIAAFFWAQIPRVSLGNVVPDAMKTWAKQAARSPIDEKQPTAKTDIGILYFDNQTTQPNLDILQKGIPLLLTHDLKKIQSISVVPRETVEALLHELDTPVTELGKTDTAVQIGRLLNAAYVINGRIEKQEADTYAFLANIVHVPSRTATGTVSTRGKLFSQLRTMEKDLLFKITHALDIQIQPRERAEIEQAVTRHAESLKFYLEAVENSDQEQYADALALYSRALKLDPDNRLAALAIQELIHLGLVVAEREPSETAEAYSEARAQAQPGVENGGARHDTRNPEDREPESPLVFNTLEEDVAVDIEEDPDTPLSILHIRTDATWDMAVDSNSLQAALDQTSRDPDLLALTDNRNTIPGVYSTDGTTLGFPGAWIRGDTGAETIYGDETTFFGLQTLGQNGYDGRPALLLNPETLEQINRNGFLAYAVQVEEDRLNKKIIEMHDNRLIQNALYTSEKYKGIRDRDAWLTQKADAQAGRVLKDANGDWVRVQQYILRPDAETVQLLNVSLRGGNSGQAGLSAMNWTTAFSEAYTGDLRRLPWNHWLNTRETDISGETVRFVAGPSDFQPPLLKDMTITFANPGEESLTNQRIFAGTYLDGSSQYRQQITAETLQVQTQNTVNTYQMAAGGSPGSGEFSVLADAAAADGFAYMLGDQAERLDVRFRVVGDGNTPENSGEMAAYQNTLTFQDMWDAMRVNESGATDIGNNNLEIQIDSQARLYDAPIDTIYVPMSRMVWKSEPTVSTP